MKFQKKLAITTAYEASLIKRYGQKMMKMTVEFKESSELDKHLLGVVFYDRDNMKIIDQNVSVAKLKGKTSWNTSFKVPGSAVRRNAKMAVFIDSKLIFDGSMPK